MKVKDRQGNLQEFDITRIKNALSRAFKECHYGTLDTSVISEIANKVYIWDGMSIEEIQDQVEELLMDYEYSDVAKEYILYRYKHKLARQLADTNKFNTTITEIATGKKNEVTNENGNKDARRFNVMRDLIAGESCKKLYKEFEANKELLALHEKGAIHIHDTDYRFMSGITNCFSGDTKFITDKGIYKFTDFNDGDEVFVPTHTGKYQKAIVRCYGKKQLYKYHISTQNREGYGVYIRATENHRWLLYDGSETTHLSVGDKLLFKNDLIFHGDLSELSLENLKWWAYGFILGDGTTVDNSYMYSHGLGKRKKSESAYNFWTRIRLCKNKIKYAPLFDKLGWSYLNIKNSNDREYRTREFDKRKFLNDKEYNNLTKDEIKYLILGLLCADGEHLVYDDTLKCYKFAGISSSNPNIIDIISKYSGVAGYYITKVNINNRDTNYGKRNYPLHEFRFILQLPQTIHCKNGTISHKIIPYKVLSKELDSIEDVYCLEVENDHSFILGCGLITGNCSLINLYDMLWNGTVVNGKLIERPHSLRTATTIATQVLVAVSSSQYGGVSITTAHLAPFVRASKEYYENKFNKYDISPEVRKVLVEDSLKKEIRDSIQTLLYQLNSMTSTNGQSPFCTVFCYIHEWEEYINENVLLIEELLHQRIKGMKGPNGNNINPAFPKIIMVLDEDNINPGTPYYHITELAAECTAKRMVPDYISAKIMKKYKEGCVFPSMGCRSFLHPWKNSKNEYQYYGRLNIGVLSINLPYYALSSKNYEDFLHNLDEIIDKISAEQRRIYNKIADTSTDVAPILWNYGAFARLPEGSKIGDAIKDGYCSASIGYMGIAECVQHFGITYGTKEGQKLGLDILKHMYDRTNMNKEKYHLSLSLYGTPAEATTTKFAKALKIFPEEEHVNDRTYITNSYHIPVEYPIDGFSKIEFEAPFQEYSSGGW